MDAAEAFVLDGSVTMVWGFEDEADDCAEAILDRMPDLQAHVPSLWPLEVANALLVGERRGRIAPADAARFLAILGAFSITVDDETVAHAWSDTMHLALPGSRKAIETAAGCRRRTGELTGSWALAFVPPLLARETARRENGGKICRSVRDRGEAVMSEATIAPADIKTLADLRQRLGGIPLERIWFHPAPGTATEKDVVAAEARENRLCELVDGTLVEKAMSLATSCNASSAATDRPSSPRSLRPSRRPPPNWWSWSDCSTDFDKRPNPRSDSRATAPDAAQ